MYLRLQRRFNKIEAGLVGMGGGGYCILNPKAKHAHLGDLRVPCYDWQAPFHWRGRMGDGLGLSRPKGPLWLHVSQLLHRAPLSTTKKGLLWVPLCIKLTWCAWHEVVWPSILISDRLKKLHVIGKTENEFYISFRNLVKIKFKAFVYVKFYTGPHSVAANYLKRWCSQHHKSRVLFHIWLQLQACKVQQPWNFNPFFLEI